MKKVFVIFILIIFFTSFLLGKAEISSKAGIDTYENMRYTSVKLEYGDTLYDLALRYNNIGISHEDYISSIKEINHINSDTVHAGCYILVSYLEN